jgi:hypothetical protein
MPLLKLWNSLRGQSTSTPQPETGKTRSANTAVSPTPPKVRKNAVKPPTKSSFGMFGGKPHGSLRKRLKTITAASVLEIGVGDGSQAIAAMEALSNKSNSIRYFGVDEFEMAGGVNLKQFHQTLRNHGIHPQLFPGSVDRGLMKIAHTFGSVDLILVANPAVIDSNPAVTGLLARISHEETNVFVFRNETWTPLQVSDAHAQRRAA